MAGELNFILTLAFLGVLALLLGKFCQSRVGSEDSQLPLKPKFLSYIGLFLLIFGMSFYYAFGLSSSIWYMIGIPSVFFGLILMLVSAWQARQDAYNQSVAAEVYPASKRGSDPETMDRLLKVARERGLLIERKSPENLDMSDSWSIRQNLLDGKRIRCPFCRYIFNIESVKIVGDTVYCPSCFQGIELN